VVREKGKRAAEIFLTEEETRRSSRAFPNMFQLAVMVKEKLDDLCPEFKSVPARHVMYFLFWRETLVHREVRGALREIRIENRKHWGVKGRNAAEEPRRGDRHASRGGSVRLGRAPRRDEIGRARSRSSRRGARGMEVYTPKHTPAEVRLYEVLLKTRLLALSGTDYHDDHFRRGWISGGQGRASPHPRRRSGRHPAEGSGCYPLSLTENSRMMTKTGTASTERGCPRSGSCRRA